MNERALRATAAWGAILSIAVVGASALLRLASSVDGAGGVTSALAPSTELAVRLVHRVCASSVAVLVLVAAWLVLRARPPAPRRIAALVVIALLTVALAVIGRHTPGYRVALVTAMNVAFGLGLAGAFWWLRAEAGDKPVRAMPLMLATLAIAALGAGSSAAAMRGSRSLEPWHVAGGIVLLGIVAGLALRDAARGPQRRARFLPVVALQLATGYALASGERLPMVEWAHVLLAALLVAGICTMGHGPRGERVRIPG